MKVTHMLRVQVYVLTGFIPAKTFESDHKHPCAHHRCLPNASSIHKAFPEKGSEAVDHVKWIAASMQRSFLSSVVPETNMGYPLPPELNTVDRPLNNIQYMIHMSNAEWSPWT